MADQGRPATPIEQLRAIREEVRFEIGLLHDRVNALLAAEAFLTIAFVAAMSDGAPGGARFAAVVAPILSLLGFLLAALAWPGIEVTVRLVLEWTSHQVALTKAHPELANSGSDFAVRGEAVRGEAVRGEAVRGEAVRGEAVRGEALSGQVGRKAVRRSAGADQRRAMLFFRAVPALFTVVWTLLTVVALVFRR